MGDPVLKKAICDDYVSAFAARCAKAATDGTLRPRVIEALTLLDEVYLSYGEAIVFEYDEKALGGIPEPYKKE